MPKKTQHGSHSKRLPAWIILLGFVGFLAYLYIGGEFGLWQHWKQRQKQRALVVEIDTLKSQQDSLRILVQRLKTDSSYIAKIAREKYNMGKNDEEIIRVIKKEK